MQTLISGRPVMMARYWYNFLGFQQQGHIVVINGYTFNGNQMVLKIRDSYPPQSGTTYTGTYNECLKGSDGYKWVTSIVRKP